MENERSRIALPLLGALLAAVVGGGLWALIAVLIEYELGLVAWAIGGMTGYAVVFLTKRNSTRVHQIIAVIASLIGILLGKYFMFAYLINDGFNGMFNSFTINAFKEVFSSMFAMMDIIFVLLAVLTAYQLPEKMTKKKTAASEQTVAAE